MGEQAVGVGVYVRPDDVTDDPDHTHKLEGTVWAVDRVLDQDSGELVDWLHVCRVWHGALEFHMLPASRVGTVDPAGPATIDSLLKLAGRALQKDGRKTDRRILALVHACGFVLGLPQVMSDAPSVFGDEPKPTVEEVVAPAATFDHDDQVAKLVARLERLDNTAVNEIRREARTRQHTYLEAGAQLELGDMVAYDALLTRWERHAARQAVAS